MSINLTQEKKLKIIEENIKDCDVKLVENTGHGFVNFEEKISKLAGNWLKTL